jgi:hypothetical protein
MKLLVSIILVLLVAASGLVAQTPVKFGAGAFAGLSIPIVQDDQKSGTVFGLRGRIKLIPVIVFEPNITFTKWGKPDPLEEIDLGIDGSKLTSFGIDATIGGLPGAVGFKPFLVVGAGSYKIKNDDTQFDMSKLGYQGGFGFLIGFVPKLDIDVRGTFLVIPIEGGSKKAAMATAGLTWNF